jgi:signal peptidase II
MSEGSDEEVREEVAKSAAGEPKKAVPENPPPRATPLQWVALCVITGVTAALDLISKSWAAKKLSMPMPRAVPLCRPPPGELHESPQHFPVHPITLVRDYLQLHYAENCGGAFGLLRGANESVRRPFFLLVTIGAVAFIVYLYRTLERGQNAMRIALPLVLGGAIGNLVDRMRLGYVVDFIDAHWQSKYHWPTFNVADIAITVGIGLMVLEWIVGPKRAPAKTKSKPKPAAT